MLVDAEWATRKNKRLTRLIKNADYAISDACVENIEYYSDRNLDKAQITRLSTCNLYIGMPQHNHTWSNRQRKNIFIKCIWYDCQQKFLYS